ncbi:hypothetical protein [Ensifer sp. YR511]|uniref:hypothetical protein n=1 Tax=Ensifer sp. YR511 TaxID=1855294 RepID=UPI00088F5EDB|nr:hypothetical protein [Ensifer sp. YR511]SDN95936.1 hypothetical protein SAMN05216328_14435 [Ensifer sp. YR511]
MVRICLLIAILTVTIFHTGRAETSEWGCEVLLCAASSNPSWHGVPQCHPPMEKLISAMKQPGFSWPICPEGGAGEPGYEHYADCPAGWTPTAGEKNSEYPSKDELSRCIRKVSTCKDGRSHFGNRDRVRTELTKDGVSRVYSGWGSCHYQEFKPRTPRERPYFFDIDDQKTGKATRYYFDLND